MSRVPLWVWWIPVVWLVSFPLAPTLEPQWDRVQPVPFNGPADKIEDLAINFLLFVPFGYLFSRWRHRPGLMTVAAAATSISAELLQLFSRVRYPSGSDVAYAVAGALAGTLLYHVLHRRRA